MGRRYCSVIDRFLHSCFKSFLAAPGAEDGDVVDLDGILDALDSCHPLRKANHADVKQHGGDYGTLRSAPSFEGHIVGAEVSYAKLGLPVR